MLEGFAAVRPGPWASFVRRAQVGSCLKRAREPLDLVGCLPCAEVPRAVVWMSAWPIADWISVTGIPAAARSEPYVCGRSWKRSGRRSAASRARLKRSASV
jgi:hypothetical protein